MKKHKDLASKSAGLSKNADLNSALQFIENIDALKSTYRKCLLMNGQREESTAEHCFSLAMAVLCLGHFSNKEIDLNKAVKMALFHDLAEALLGDVFHYDKKTTSETNHDEAEALRRILLPLKETMIHDEIFELWHDFEHGDTPEAVFLRGVDRFLPMYHNYKTNGHTWVKFGVTKEMALKKNSHIQDGSHQLWEFTRAMVEDSYSKGWLS
jgi:putative hydrolase of HD superfamily